MTKQSIMKHFNQHLKGQFKQNDNLQRTLVEFNLLVLVKEEWDPLDLLGKIWLTTESRLRILMMLITKLER